jgi:DNA-binding response OmpR family regulator
MAKILVVDDSQETREFVERALGEEHEIFAIDNWMESKEYLVKYDLDLVLLDVDMPGFKGDQIAEILLKRETSKAMHIVLFSAMDEYALRRKAREVGAHGYISKTFDEKLLRVRVRRYLR